MNQLFLEFGRVRRACAVGAAAALTIAALSSRASLDAAASRNFGWKASSRSGAIYLIGSVHLLSNDFYPLNPALETAFKDADLLVEEADLGDMLDPSSQMQLLTRGMLAPNQSLEKVVSPATFAAVNKRVDAIGMPIDPMKRFKPWMLAMMFEQLEWQKAGFDPNLGLDKHFYDRAKSEGKTIQGLETVEYQISRFDDMTMDQQDHLLAETLKDIDTEQGSLSRLVESWRTGDAPAVERIVLKDLQQEPVLYERLLVERNKNWLPKLEALFARRGHAFVVVGAAHLVGPDGLLSMLKAKGYTLEQL
jgi:uncharacterized protein YbaP (TraB family)